MRARVLAGSLLFGSVLAGALLLTTPAFAEDPPDLGGAYVLDRSGVLNDQQGEVRDALDRLFDQTGAKLFVVYVDSFTNPSDSLPWADRAAGLSGLGDADMLLAIATGDRNYAVSVGQNFPVSDDKIDQVVNDKLIPALRDDDWAGGAIAFADGLTAAQAPSPVLPIIGGVVVVGAGTAVVVGVVRSRRKKKTVADAAAADVAALDQQAGQLLVQLDDALKTSEQELGFAQAQFGDDQTKDFVSALTDAKALAKQAFELQQKLDDAYPETPEQHRAMTEQLIQLAQQADAVLDAQAEAFDQLRALEKNAPQVLEQVAAEQIGLDERIATAETTIAGLKKSYPDGDLTSLTGLPAQARKLDAFAATTVADARKVVAGAKGAQDAGVAVAVRAAQQAVGQVDQLLASVDRTKDELAAKAKQDAAAAVALDSQLRDARSRVDEANDYMTTHRGAVGTTARTRVSEAARHLDQATGAMGSDPAAAAVEANQAASMAAAALSLAMTDVERAESALSLPQNQSTYQQGSGFDGAILGGILGGLFSGGGSSSGGSSSGGSWWGGSSGGGSSSGWSSSGWGGGGSHHSTGGGGGLFGGSSGGSSGRTSRTSGRRGSSGRF
jgi:uncharacterized membrane protein YgcG